MPDDDDKSIQPTVPKRPRLGGSKPPHPPRSSSSNLRTFTDILGNGTSRADSALGDSAPEDAWSAIARTVNELPSIQIPVLNAPIESSLPYQQQQQQQKQQLQSAYQLKNLTSLPNDLSLKTNIRISSYISLLWTRLCSQRDSYGALQDVLVGNDPSVILPSDNSNRQIEKEEEENGGGEKISPLYSLNEAYSLFYRRLIHFRFPETPISSALASVWTSIFSGTKPTSAKNEKAYNLFRGEAYHRLYLWQHALQSVYYGYRYQQISTFYVIIPNSVIIFHHAHDHDRTPIALLSSASAGLRSLLSDYVVTFTIGRVEGNDEVCVHVKGEYNVHTLYNLIIGASHKLSGANDVPTIICDRPFVGGTPTLAHVDFARSARTNAAPTADNEKHDDEGNNKVCERNSTRFQVQVRGLLTPRQLEGICQALYVTQQANFKAAIETEPRSIGLNNPFSSINVEDNDCNGDDSTSKKKKTYQTITGVAAFTDMDGLCVSTRIQ